MTQSFNILHTFVNGLTKAMSQYTNHIALARYFDGAHVEVRTQHVLACKGIKFRRMFGGQAGEVSVFWIWHFSNYPSHLPGRLDDYIDK